MCALRGSSVSGRHVSGAGGACERGGAPAGLSSTAVLPAPVAPTVSASAARAVAVSLPLAEARPPPEKRRRLATEIIRELQGAKELLDSGHISQGQFEELKRRLFADE